MGDMLSFLLLSVAVFSGAFATNLWALRKNIQWKQSLILMLGGLAGVPACRRAGEAALCSVIDVQFSKMPDGTSQHCCSMFYTLSASAAPIFY